MRAQTRSASQADPSVRYDYGKFIVAILRTPISLAGTRALGKDAVGLEEYGASFEASLREAPQVEAFFLIPSTTYPLAEEQPGTAGARLEARAHRMQRILAQPRTLLHPMLVAG
jgi:hypothetical protein